MANNIAVHAATWNALSTDDRERIQRIVSGLSNNAQIKADESAPKLESMTAAQFGGINFCKIGCDLGEAAAVAACGALTGPAAAVCVAAAHTAADFCRSKC